MIEVSGSGSIPLTNVTGSRRPKNICDLVDQDPDSEHCLQISYKMVKQMRGINNVAAAQDGI
jgi:hypothetical protein